MPGIAAALLKKARNEARDYNTKARTFFSFASTLTLFSILLGIKWVLLVYAMYYLFMCKKISLYYVDTPQNKEIVAKLKGLEKVFYPHILWLLPQIQTVSYFMRKIVRQEFAEKEISQEDGGSFFIDVYDPLPNAVSSHHTVVIVHGLGGSSQSKHVTLLGAHLRQQGHRVIAMSARGTKHKLKTPVFFHIGWTKDLVATVKYALNNYPGSVSCIGFSLGGHWVVKMFGEISKHFSPQEEARVCGGMAISTPFDFVMLSAYMKRPIPRRIYNRGFVQKIYKFVQRNREVYEQHNYPVEKILRANTMQEIDEELTSRVFGITDLDAYYYRESAVRVIPAIRKPVLILNSKDDPIVPHYTIPVSVCLQSEHVILALTERGGHMGFLGYNDYLTYAEEAAIEFVNTVYQRFGR